MAGQLPMTTEQLDIYNRIKEFRFDDIDTPLPFVLRLQRDNGWSTAFTVRAVSEYRKFAFLALVAGHPVTPSDQVDQVWHLHLLYTRSYWERFCKQTLGCPLHHEPTKGGREEKEKFGAWYAATLASYRRYFAQEPPADIWPGPETRFGEDLHFERINRKRFFVVSRIWTTATAALAAVAGLVFWIS